MTTLVLVHGFMGGSAQWDGYVDSPSEVAKLVAVDLPGFGARADSPALDSIAGYADWVIAHLRNIGVERYHLLGHSMGGMIVQEIALKDRDRIDRLVLYATGARGTLPGRFETIEDSKRRAETDGATSTARRIAATWFLHKEAAEGFEHCAAIAAQTRLAAIKTGLDAMQAWSGEPNLNRIDLKTLVLWGDRDRTYPWDQIHRLWTDIPEASLAVVPGCAHAVHAEKPELFRHLLADFLLS
ncbi:MAG: alpha/beta hydrolase [Pseudomonadota bacterium]